jgi:hypothetical protein
MRIVPPIRPIRDGKILDVNLINQIINRTEYGAELLARYKMVAGSNIFVEQAGNGLGVSYLTALAGGAGTGSGGAGTGSGGAGIGKGGAGTGSGGSGTPEPVTPPNTITISGSISRFTEAVTIQGTLANKIARSQLELYIGGSLVSTASGDTLGFLFNYNTQQVNLGTPAFVRQFLDGNLVGRSNTIQLQYASTGPLCGILEDANWENTPDQIIFNYSNPVKQQQLLKWGFYTYSNPLIMRINISGSTVVNTGCFGGGYPAASTIEGDFLLPGLTPFAVQLNKCGGSRTFGTWAFGTEC